MKEDKDMRQNLLRAIAFGLLLFLLSSGASAQQGAPPMATAQPSAQGQGDEAPLTNADVVKLCKLDLGDQVVIAKINQAKTVNFNLDTDSLIKLKEESVSKDVIAAMLKRSTPIEGGPAAGGVPPRPANGAPATNGSGGAGSAVRLCTTSGDVALLRLSGEQSMTYAFVTMLRFMDYPGLKAQTRTTDRQPTLVILSDADPRGQFFLVKAKSNKRHDNRSVKVGAGFFGTKGINVPDKDWTIPYEATQEQPGTWRLRVPSGLTPGEYCIYVAAGDPISVGSIYDFGVD
jgi:hypothetical protein